MTKPLSEAARKALAGVSTATLTTQLFKRGLRNTFVQGENKENYSALIMVAAEGRRHSSAGLAITQNEAGLVPGLQRRTSFVADESGQPITIENNRLDPQIVRFERR